VIPGKKYTPELLLQIAWRYKWVMVLPAILIAAGVVAWTRQLHDIYRSDALIMVIRQRIPETYVRSTVTTSLAERLQAISQQIMSRTRLERIIEDLNLYPEARKSGIMEDVVEAMRGQIDIQPVKGDAFRVGFISEDPRTAMRVAERLATLFIDESLRDREVLAEGTSQFLEAQLEDARRLLIDNEKKLEEYRRRHDGELPNQLNANMQGLHNTEMQIQSLIDSANRDRERHLVLERAIADAALAEETSVPLQAAPGPTSAAQQLRAAQETLRVLELRLKPQHPDVLRAKRTVAELQQLADAEAADRPVSPDSAAVAAQVARRNRLDDMKAEIANLDKQIAYKTEQEKKLRDNIGLYQQRIEGTPSRESELTDLMRDYGTFQQAYVNLLSKKQDSQVSANLERRQIGEQFRILDPARLPTRPFSPNRPRYYGMGIIAGIGVGLGLAGLLEYFDRTMRSESDVLTALNVPVLATIPLIKIQRRGRRRVAAAAGGAAAMFVALVAVTLRFLR
jgi:polysaccharide chain length determinant protein (PEP-CTERM system associated)